MTPLKGLVGSGCLKDNSKHLPERNAPAPCEAEKDDGCGYLIQGELTWSETVGSDGHSTESCNRGVDDPSNLIEAASVILSETSDDRLDALCTQGVAGGFAVVSAIWYEDIRMTERPASLARNGGGVGDCLQDLSVIDGIRQRGVDEDRQAVSVQDGSVLCRQFAGVNGTWAKGVTAAECPTHDAIADGQFGFKDADALEQREKVRVEIVPRYGFVPSSKSAVSGATRAAEFEWQVFPSAPSHKHVPQNFDRRAVRHARPAAFRTHGLFRGQQSLQLRPASVHLPSWLPPWFTKTMKGASANHVPNEVLSGPVRDGQQGTRAKTLPTRAGHRRRWPPRPTEPRCNQPFQVTKKKCCPVSTPDYAYSSTAYCSPLCVQRSQWIQASGCLAPSPPIGS